MPCVVSCEAPNVAINTIKVWSASSSSLFFQPSSWREKQIDFCFVSPQNNDLSLSAMFSNTPHPRPPLLIFQHGFFFISTYFTCCPTFLPLSKLIMKLVCVCSTWLKVIMLCGNNYLFCDKRPKLRREGKRWRRDEQLSNVQNEKKRIFKAVRLFVNFKILLYGYFMIRLELRWNESQQKVCLGAGALRVGGVCVITIDKCAGGRAEGAIGEYKKSQSFRFQFDFIWICPNGQSNKLINFYVNFFVFVFLFLEFFDASSSLQSLSSLYRPVGTGRNLPF